MGRCSLHGGRWLAALVGCLVCVAAAAQTPEPVLLRLMAWEPPGEHLLGGTLDLAAAFEAANPDTRLNINYEPWSAAAQRLKYWCGTLRTYAPDLTVMRDGWLAQYEDSIIPLDGVVPERDLKAFVPAVLNRCRVHGKLLGLPWMLNSRVLYYRPDLLQQARLKPPQTLDELKQVATALAKTGKVWGLGLPAQPDGGGVDAYLGFLLACGGRPQDDKGRLTLRSTEAIRALQVWLDLQQAGALEPEALSWNSGELDEAFANGKLGMVFSGPALGRYLRRQQPNLKFATCPLPGGATPVSQVYCDALVILKSTPQADRSRLFARFLATAEVQRAMWIMGGIPTQSALVAEAKPSPNIGPFVEHLERAQGMPLTGAEPLGRAVEHALWLALSGRVDADHALQMATVEEESPLP
jgi:multiple sugar transport system substrate-binding protein